jgi:hypothetical protein
LRKLGEKILRNENGEAGEVCNEMGKEVEVGLAFGVGIFNAESGITVAIQARNR